MRLLARSNWTHSAVLLQSHLTLGGQLGVLIDRCCLATLIFNEVRPADEVQLCQSVWAHMR